MDARQFLAEFGHIASAPEGIQRLREMIYNLAITGDLTQQLSEDGDAKTLLGNIELTRQRLINSKQFKRTAKLESEPLRVPGNITLPSSWRWTRLLDIGEISPRNEAKDEDTAAFIPMSGVPQLHNGTLVSEARTWGEIKKGFTHFSNGDVVVAKITPCFENGKAAVIAGLSNPRGIGAGTTELHVFRAIHPDVLPAYIYVFLRSPFFAVEGERNMTGTAGQKRVPTEYFATRAMPLPPFAEQARIVAKVDELMALCDKLEAQQQAREKLRDITGAAFLDLLSSAQSPNELFSAWKYLNVEASLLLNSEAAIQHLRKTTLDLAVAGRLSFRMPNDGNAVELVEQIQASKKRLIATNKISKRKPVLGETLQETVLPSHWTSLTLDEAISHIDAGWSPACLPHPRRDESTWGILRTTSVQPLQFQFNEHKELPSSLQPRPQYEVHSGDILITRAGPKNRVGICCVVQETPERLMISDKLIRFHIVDDLIDARFVALCLSAGESGKILERQKSGMAESQMNISQDKLRAIPIPLPPRAEQERILQKVEGFMTLCDQLYDQLKLKQKIHGRLAASGIAAITGIRTEEEEELKAPKTELISKLRLLNNPGIKEQAPLAAILARHQDEMATGDLWQRYGGEIDTFYAQLKLEVGKGWIAEPSLAEMREVEEG